MNGQDLKNSILQLAIQGKLVEQREEEGTAKELLEQIRTEKEQLVKQGKIKKEKTLSEITDEEIPFNIPNNWEWVRLGDYCEKITDQVASGSFASLKENVTSYKENNYAVMVKTADFSNGFSKNLTYTDEKGYNFLSNSNLFGGELILSNIGSVGKCFIVPDLGTKMTLAPNAIMLKLISNDFRDFLYYFIMSRQGFNELISISSGTTMRKFNKTDLKKILVPIPPLEEQKRIVAKIEELLPYVETYDKAYSEVEELNKKFPDDMKKSILQYAIQGKLVEQREEDGTAEELYQQIQEEKKNLIKGGKIKNTQVFSEILEEEIPFDIPENWKWIRLIDILLAKPTNGYSPKGVSYETKIKNLTLTATTSGTFNKSAYKYVDIEIDGNSPYWLKNNDLLIQRSNSREYVGTSCIYTGEDNEFIYPDLIMRMRVHPIIILEYIDYVLKAPFSRKYFKENASGTSESMPKINQNTVSNALIPLPPLEEQKRIVEKIEKLIPYTKQLVK